MTAFDLWLCWVRVYVCVYLYVVLDGDLKRKVVEKKGKN